MVIFHEETHDFGVMEYPNLGSFSRSASRISLDLSKRVNWSIGQDIGVAIDPKQAGRF